MQKTQPFLYRYYSNPEYIVDVVKNKRLYHNTPSEFNDPFDCRPRMSFKYDPNIGEDTWRKLLYYLIKMESDGASDAEIYRRVSMHIQNGLHKNQAWLDDVCADIRNLGDLLRVCCFAKSVRNMMLWAHYADKQKGVAFQFLKSELNDKTSREYRGVDVAYVQKVHEVEDYVHSLDCWFENGETLEANRFIFATKTHHWEREDEVRFFTYPDQKYVSFREYALPGIIFGALCPDNLIKDVQNEVHKWQSPPRLFKVSFERSIHKLWIERLLCGQKDDERATQRRTR